MKSEEITGEKFGTIRDLDMVLNSDACKGSEVNFSKENVLMLESDEVKVHNITQNSLIVDEFSRNDVWPSDENEKPRD